MGKKSAQKKKSVQQPRPATPMMSTQAAPVAPAALKKPVAQRTLTSLGGEYVRPSSAEEQREVLTLIEQERFVKGDVAKSLVLFSILVVVIAGIAVFDRNSPVIGQLGSRLSAAAGLQN